MGWAIIYAGLATVPALLIIAGIFLLENGSGTNPANASDVRFSLRRREISKLPLVDRKRPP